MDLKKKPGRKPKRPSEEEFIEVYIKDDRTAEEVAEIYDVSVQTVYNWANQLRSQK